MCHALEQLRTLWLSTSERSDSPEQANLATSVTGCSAGHIFHDCLGSLDSLS